MLALRAAVATTLTIVTAPALADGYTSLGPRLLTPRDAAIPRDGGVLVGCCEVTYKDDHDRDPTIQPRWRFHSARASQRPSIEPLAPGLAVYRPARRGDVILLDEDGAELGSFHDGTNASRFAVGVPSITGVSVITSPDSPAEWEVHTVTAPPVNAVAVIVYAIDGRRRTAIDWQPLENHELPRRRWIGSRTPRAAEKVEIRWVDAFGRRSPASRVVAVGSVFACGASDSRCAQSMQGPGDGRGL